MALSAEETTLLTRMLADFPKLKNADTRLSRYYEGLQRLEHIGLAVPTELRRFETVVNIPRMAVDEVERRLDVKSLILPDHESADVGLREAWDYNNLDSEASLLHKETMIYGRGFVTVSSNEDDSEQPFITVESPRYMTCLVDNKRRRMDAALRLYVNSETRRDSATLYTPNSTIWLERENGGKWVEEDRDNHNLGRVPVVMFLNRRRLGDWTGISEMADVIPLTDAAARTLTNLQIAAETHSVPQKYVLGMSKGDFVDANNNPIPVWESYFSGIWAHQNTDAKVGQFSPSDLKNFHETVNHYMALAAAVTGLPVRYMGQYTANPAAEGAIRADEARLVKNTERKASSFGDGWGWTLALRERFRTGEWIDGNRVKVEWHDPGTPTFAQKADALQKLAGGIPIISRQGAWDELGWSDARKAREREYFDEENQDPYLNHLAVKEAVNDSSGGDTVPEGADGADTGDR